VLVVEHTMRVKMSSGKTILWKIPKEMFHERPDGTQHVKFAPYQRGLANLVARAADRWDEFQAIGARGQNQTLTGCGGLVDIMRLRNTALMDELAKDNDLFDRNAETCGERMEPSAKRNRSVQALAKDLSSDDVTIDCNGVDVRILKPKRSDAPLIVMFNAEMIAAVLGHIIACGVQFDKPRQKKAGAAYEGEDGADGEKEAADEAGTAVVEAADEEGDQLDEAAEAADGEGWGFAEEDDDAEGAEEDAEGAEEEAWEGAEEDDDAEGADEDDDAAHAG
jgi:hypothetical protein